jgi:hypothetical protein
MSLGVVPGLRSLFVHGAKIHIIHLLLRTAKANNQPGQSIEEKPPHPAHSKLQLDN